MQKNESIKRIERISRLLLAASVVAVIIGIGMEGMALIHLVTGLKAGIPRYELAEIITEMAEGLVLIIHYFFVSKFFITALREEVPFTYEAGHEMRVLGWETILLPIAVAVISIIAFGGTKPVLEIIEIEIYELILGVFLIQTGYVIDYATDKTLSGHRHHLICELMEEKYPSEYKEIEAVIDGQLAAQKTEHHKKATKK